MRKEHAAELGLETISDLAGYLNGIHGKPAL
jgi:glycine betaine/choline ABC-type transport system substrate-binding protein